MLQICRLRLQVYPLQSRRHWSVANDKDRQENRPCDRLTIISSAAPAAAPRSEEHTSKLQSLMRISYAVFCLKKKNQTNTTHEHTILVTNTSYHTTNKRTE